MITAGVIGKNEQHPNGIAGAGIRESAEAVGRSLDERCPMEIARAPTPEATETAFRLAEQHAGAVTRDRP